MILRLHDFLIMAVNRSCIEFKLLCNGLQHCPFLKEVVLRRNVGQNQLYFKFRWSMASLTNPQNDQYKIILNTQPKTINQTFYKDAFPLTVLYSPSLYLEKRSLVLNEKNKINGNDR